MERPSSSRPSAEHVIQTGGESYFLGRPRTSLGPQGDHVTAYSLFEEFIKQLPKGDLAEFGTNIITTLQNLKFMLEKYKDEFEEEIDKSEETELESNREDIESAIKEISDIMAESVKKFMSAEEIEEVINNIESEKLKEKGREALLHL